MDVKQAFSDYPYSEEKYNSKQEYYQFIGSKVNSNKFESIGRLHRRHLEAMRLVKKTVNAQGTTTSETYRIVGIIETAISTHLKQ